MPKVHRERAVALSSLNSGIGRKDDDWTIVSVRALYGARAYVGKTRLRM